MCMAVREVFCRALGEHQHVFIRPLHHSGKNYCFYYVNHLFRKEILFRDLLKSLNMHRELFKKP